MITGARVLGGVVDDEPIAQSDEEVAEALPDGVLTPPGLLEVDANAGFPERAVLVDQGDKGPLASGYRGSQVGQVVKLLFRLGIEEPGSQHRRDPPAIRQRCRKPVRPDPARKHRSGHRGTPFPLRSPHVAGPIERLPMHSESLELHGKR